MKPNLPYTVLAKISFSSLLFLILAGPVCAQRDIDLQKTKSYAKFEAARDTLKMALAGGDSAQIAECYYLLGKRYMSLSNYILAKHSFHQSIAIRERLGSWEELTRTYGRLVECNYYDRSGSSFDEDILYTNKVWFYAKKAKTRFALMVANRLMASLHMEGFKIKKKGQPLPFAPSVDSAICYQTLALKIATELKRPLDIALGNDLLGNTWYDIGKLRQGILFEKKAIELYRRGGFIAATIQPSLEIGSRYIELQNYKSAKHWIDKAESLADSLNWSGEGYLANSAQAYVRYYSATGDLRNALRYQQESYEQRLKDEESYRKSAIDGINLSLENDRKEYQLGLQKKELEVRREKAEMQFWLFLLSGILLISACIIAILSHRLYKRYKAKSHKNEYLFLDQSHRIKNNFQTILDLLHLQQSDLSDPKSVQVLEESILRVEAMSFIHKRLYGKNRTVEIETRGYIQDLVDSALRSYNLAHVVIKYNLNNLLLHVDKAIPLGLIVNELINNACKYALSHHPEPQLFVTCTEDENSVFFVFEDNGQGFEFQDTKESFGLELVQIWVDNLGGRSSFTFEHGTRFTLTFDKVVKVDRSRESELNVVN